MTDKLKVVAAIAWANIGKEEGEIYSVTLDRQPYHDTPLVKLSDLDAALERVKVLEAMYEARELEAHQLSEQIIVLRRAFEELQRLDFGLRRLDMEPLPPEACRIIDAAMEVKHG